MTIPVACKCGKKLAAKDEFAGKTVKCPQCGQPLKIPTAKAKSAASDVSAAHKLLDELGLSAHEGERCPECGEALPSGAVLCVHCGYNLKLKRFIKPEGAPAVSPKKPGAKPKPKSEVDRTLAQAAEDLEHEPVQHDAGYGSAWSAWILTLVLLVVAAGVIAGGVVFFNHMEKLNQERAASRTDDGY